MFYYGFDPTYFLVLIGLVITLGASLLVKSTFAKYSSLITSRRITGAMAAEEVLHSGGVYDVSINRIAGQLTDNFNPQTNKINLSESVHDSASAAAVGVAAHEAGHALQYASGYSLIKIRTAIIPVCNISSTLATPLFIIGLLMTSYIPEGTVGTTLMYTGILAFSTAVLFQLVTLPVEFNASNRAIEALTASGNFTSDELDAARKVLRAAALTYVAGLAASLLQVLRLVLIANNRRGRN
ncbi:MAG: zinc metallopeptidase [Clostridia bacterium]|nr:zinc metallopeptidase [Clostridia bacterium]